MSVNVSFSQGPQLVSDFQAGPNDAFEKFYEESIHFGNQIILALSSSATGLELAVIENGELRIIKDIAPGQEGSNPELFIEFKGRVYFKANDGTTSTSRLWVTDGTEAGTQKVDFTPQFEGVIQNFIISNSGYLYFSVDDALYRTFDGINFHLVDLMSGSLVNSSVDDAPLFTKFQNEIAYIHGRRNDKQLFVVEGDTSILKSSLSSLRSRDDLFGLTDMGGTLMFATDFSSWPDLDNNYMYRPVLDTLVAFAIDGDKAGRLNPLDTGAALAWVPLQGYYHVKGTDPAIEFLFAETQGFYGFDELMRSVSYNDHFAFINYGGELGENYLLFSDGTAQGTRQLKTVKSFQSSFLSFDKYAIFAEGISDGLEPKLTMIDMVSGDLISIHDFTAQQSIEVESIRPLGVLDNTLYFVSKLDVSVGAEVYKIELDFFSSVESVAKFDVHLDNRDRQFRIRSETSLFAKVSQFNAAGARLSVHEIQTNTWHPLAAYKGVLFINVEIDGKQKTFKVVNSGQ